MMTKVDEAGKVGCVLRASQIRNELSIESYRRRMKTCRAAGAYGRESTTGFSQLLYVPAGLMSACTPPRRESMFLSPADPTEPSWARKPTRACTSKLASRERTDVRPHVRPMSATSPRSSGMFDISSGVRTCVADIRDP